MKTFARHIGHIRINGQTTIHNLKIGKQVCIEEFVWITAKAMCITLHYINFFLTLQNKKYAAFFETKDENPSLF